MKIYIMGPSGAGTTTLGKELSKRLKIPHFDSDDLFWEKTDPPFTTQRGIEDLHEKTHKLFSLESFILTGDVLNWGLDKNLLLNAFTHTVYLYIPWDVRELRIREREHKRFGDRISPNGDMYKTHEAFIEWASHYDDGRRVGRNRESQLNFIGKFEVNGGKVLKIEHEASVKELIEHFLSHFSID